MSRPIDWHELAAVILERGQLPLCELALAVHRRKLDVLHALREGPFVRVGRTKASRWDIASPVRSFDARSFVELHPDWSLEWANEVVAWLVDVGFVTSVNGNGRVVVTERGLAAAAALEALA